MDLIFNVDFDIASVLIFFIVFSVVYFLYDLKIETTKKFLNFTILAFVTTILDLLTAITISNPNKFSNWTNTILNSIYLLCSFFPAWLISIYIQSCIKFKSKVHFAIDCSIAVIYIILLITNLFTGILFSFTEGLYIHGPLFLCNFGVSFLFFAHLFFIFCWQYKKFTVKQRFLNIIIFVLPDVICFLQILFPEYLFSQFAYAIITLILLFTQQTPDFVELEYLRKNLELEVQKQTTELRRRERQIDLMSQEATQALAQAIDEKDNYTNGHSNRVSIYSMLLAQALDWDVEKVERLRIAALLHDVGKIGIPDAILKNPNKLTSIEYEQIKTHTERGGKILHNFTTLPGAEIVAKYHHERYDGTGYPGEYKGKDIPEFARIVAIADAFDAMNSKRIYRNNLPFEEVYKRMEEGRGTQFDPDFLDTFLKLIDDGIIY